MVGSTPWAPIKMGSARFASYFVPSGRVHKKIPRGRTESTDFACRSLHAGLIFFVAGLIQSQESKDVS